MTSPWTEDRVARRKFRSDDRGTALTEILPWLRTIDPLVDAARALLDGTGSEAELARKLDDYDAATRALEVT